MKVGKKILEWDEGALIDEEVAYRIENWMENGYEVEPEEEKVREGLNQDMHFWEASWEGLIDCLTVKIKKKNPNGYWKARVNNFGWRGLDGCNVFYAEDGVTFLKEILPNCDCTFRIFNYGKGVAIQNFHHDSPMGKEWYYVLPTTEGVYEKFEQGR